MVLKLNHEPTDFGIAQTLVENGTNFSLKSKPGAGWLTWDMALGRWFPDNYRTFLGKEAGRYRATDTVKGNKIANRLEGKNTLDGVMAVMKDMPEFQAEWDKNTNLIGMANGVLNAKTLEFRKQKPDDYISECIPTIYDERALCPRFDRFMVEIQPEGEKRDYVQKLLGSGLLPASPDQLFHFWKGDGANGKSILQRIVLSVIDKMGGVVSTSLFVKNSDEGAKRFTLSRLQNKRIIFSGEVPRGKNLEEYIIKQLTGEDSVVVEAKNQQPEEVDFFATFIMLVNDIPTMSEDSPAMKRRLRIVTFDQSFINKQDSDLYNKLSSEREGILAWLVRGANLYLTEGLGYPKSIKDSTDEAIKQSFVYTESLEDMLEIDLKNEYKNVTFAGIREKLRKIARDLGQVVRDDKVTLGMAIKVFMGDVYDVREGSNGKYYAGWKYKEVRTDVPDVFKELDIRFE